MKIDLRTITWERVLKSFVMGVFIITPIAARAATSPYFYTVDFGTPPHQTNQPPVTGLGSDTPSSVVFGNPLVVSSFDDLTNQPLVFSAIGYQQIQFDLGNQSPNYFVDFNFETHNLNPSLFAFAVIFDTPSAEVFYLHGGGFIEVPPANSGFLPGWTDDEVHHMHIAVDLMQSTWTFLLDNRPPEVGHFQSDSGDILSLRINLSTWYDHTPDDTNVQVAVDNIRIGTVPITQFSACPSNGAVPLVVHFSSPAVDNYGWPLTNWSWDFGDNTSSSIQNPMHIYTAAGKFSPSLVASNALGFRIQGTGPPIVAVEYSGLVLNGNFESGDFLGWTFFDSSSSTFVDDGSLSGILPYAGRYDAALGGVGELALLSQTIETVPGQTYLLSLWLNSPDGRTPNEFLVTWDGYTNFHKVNLPPLGWTNMAFAVTSSGYSTLLQFEFRDDPSYLGLDQISVVPLQVTLGGAAWTGSNFSFLATVPPGLRYQVEYSMDLSSSNWLNLGNILSTSNSALTISDTPTNSQTFYRVRVIP